jgi:hypothetical protein
MNWYSKITADLGEIPAFMIYYENELEKARKDVRITGKIEKNLAELPGITEFRFNQLQEIEAILNYLNIQLNKIRRKHFQKYLENYNRTLSSREAEKYVDGEDEVINYETLINDVALIRNKWLGIMKGLESKNFTIGHMTKLKCAGMEDYYI